MSRLRVDPESWLNPLDLVDGADKADLQQIGPNSTRKRPALDAAIGELVEAGRARFTPDGKRVVVRPELLGGGNGAA